jgi:hypothetical protein
MIAWGPKGKRMAKESREARALKLRRQVLLRKVKAKYTPRERSKKPKVG